MRSGEKLTMLYIKRERCIYTEKQETKNEDHLIIS